MLLAWKLRALIYRIIRPLFVKDIDPNEDFNCIVCNKPVLRRVLQCSEACWHETKELWG